MQMAVNDSFFMVPDEDNWVAVLNSADKLTTNKIGFTAGSGGSVTQTGTINSDVTLNKPCGKITLVPHDFSNNDIQGFTFNNSYIEINDIVILSFRDGNAKLYNQVVVTGNGSCSITVGDAHNQSTGILSVVINFAIIKGDS